MVRATLRAIQYAKINRDETVKLIAKWTELATALAQGSYDLAVGTWTATGIPGPEALRVAMEEVKNELKLELPPDASGAFDWSFVKK